MAQTKISLRQIAGDVPKLKKMLEINDVDLGSVIEHLLVRIEKLEEAVAEYGLLAAPLEDGNVR